MGKGEQNLIALKKNPFIILNCESSSCYRDSKNVSASRWRAGILVISVNLIVVKYEKLKCTESCNFPNDSNDSSLLSF